MTLSSAAIAAFWHKRSKLDDAAAARFHTEHTPYDLAAIKTLCFPDLAVLDLGCGTCSIANLLAEQVTRNVHAVDYQPDFLGYANPPVTTEVGNAAAYRTERKFDLIVNMGVITYLPDPEDRLRMYRNCHAMLKPHGKLFLKAQFGVETQVEVNHFSAELNADYQAIYPHVTAEQALLERCFTVTRLDPYPPAFNRYANTHYYYFIGAPKGSHDAA